MAERFIEKVVTEVKSKHTNIEQLCFILPSKRASIFLKQELAKHLNQPIFSPDILSIEEFVESLTDLRQINDIELLFKFYETYKELTKKEDLESFESFIKWAKLLLQDFNEIDRYLIPQDHIFNYLAAIQDLNHWSLEKEPTELMKRHLNFWNHLKTYYDELTASLITSQQGYQGLIYREACENLELYLENNGAKQHIFLGFNALNTAESKLIQGLLHNGNAEIYWDTDQHFIDDPIHDAGHFIRSYLKTWPYFKQDSFNWISSNYHQPKQIDILGVPKNVGQAKLIGQLLEQLSITNPQLNNVAVVLGEENLLLPLLNSIPEDVGSFNVTMGLPLKYIPLVTLFETLFSIHKNNSTTFYYKDVIKILSHPALINVFNKYNNNAVNTIIKYITDYNLVYLNSSTLKTISESCEPLFKLIFDPWADDVDIALKRCIQLIFEIKAIYKAKTNSLELEYLYHLHRLFNQLKDYHNTFDHLHSIEALYTVFKDLISSATLDFKGEPLEGLQVMGMLESRVLDFETVIISSVNEGILPAGKTPNSFIPYDLKREHGLPTYKEKDAVYTYHFYRLIQRAKTVYLIYNTEIDALKGGEKSRFITQLEIENIHKIKHSIITPEVPIIKASSHQVSKTPAVINELKNLAKKGFSPSSLTNYIRNPIDFYYEKVLEVKDSDTVEEHIEANTLGTVIHNTLEILYKPLENQFLNIAMLQHFHSKIEAIVYKEFLSVYKEEGFASGKNLIIFEIAKHYIKSFIDLEIASLTEGNQIKILAIETDLNISLDIKDLDFPVGLKGVVDRIDEFNGMVRVIDYKTGKVDHNNLEIVNWEDLNTDYKKYSKSFQILCYALMLFKQHQLVLPATGGVFSFKNLNSGFLAFGQKPTQYSRKKDHNITEETLKAFEFELHQLILEIFNPKIDFVEKEVD